MQGVNKIISIVDSLTSYINKSIETLPDAHVEILLECINVHLKHIKNEAISLKMDLIADNTSEESTESNSTDGKVRSDEDIFSSLLNNIPCCKEKKEDKAMSRAEDFFKIILDNVKNCKGKQNDEKPISLIDILSSSKDFTENVDKFKEIFGEMFREKL